MCFDGEKKVGIKIKIDAKDFFFQEVETHVKIPTKFLCFELIQRNFIGFLDSYFFNPNDQTKSFYKNKFL